MICTGRVASKIAPRVKQLKCFDIAEEMLKKAQNALKSLEITNASFTLLSETKLPADLTDQLDFVYAFDVFPHVDLHTQVR
jgi:predicted TPR repeat methyltransferase